MRKEVVGREKETPPVETADWLDLESLARVDITSEDPAFPIESALIMGEASRRGWRASKFGPQTIRVHFDKPQKIRRIYLRFVESDNEREQEFLLSYLQKNLLMREIARQQWTFSPGGSREEIENYFVDLEDIIALELTIDADRGRNVALATLAELRVA